MPSHLTLSQAIALGYDPNWWLANSLADRLAGETASSYQLPSWQLQDIYRDDESNSLILRRLVAIAMYLVPLEKPQHAAYKEPCIPKETKIRDMAKQAGHCLDSNRRCVRCNLQVNHQHSMAYLEAVLHMKCLGAVRGQHIMLHNKLQEDLDSNENFMFHNLAVHGSHNMATHVSLRVHFCTHCGAYGVKQRVNLARPCPPCPRQAG